MCQRRVDCVIANHQCKPHDRLKNVAGLAIQMPHVTGDCVIPTIFMPFNLILIDEPLDGPAGSAVASPN